ncbi:MAG: hypothetical protein JXB15_03360 [Anaerolineales bacterium]|nr:hypothetical protein [Anaerolineales bacterium]
MPESEMPIFARTYDFLTWLLPATNHFPRLQRHFLDGSPLHWQVGRQRIRANE